MGNVMRALCTGLFSACLLAAGCEKRGADAPAKLAGSNVPPQAEASKQVPVAQLFERVTETSGVQFVHQAGTNYAMPDQIAAGVALLDFNRDGILDLYLVQNSSTNSTGANQLYQGIGGGKFKNVSEGSGVEVKGVGMGAIAGDLNNDGWPDLVVTEYGATRVFANQAGRKFTEVSKTCGVDNPRWGVAASFIDFDRDGRLDLVVGNYVDYDPSQVCHLPTGEQEFCAPSSFPPTISRLWRNVTKTPGAEPQFEDWTVRSGIAKQTGMALGVICADFTGDHWPDIFFADDGRPNRLFVNQKNGTFTEEAALRGLAYNAMGATAANMGVVFADLNGDGSFDLFVTHLTDEFHALFRQQEPGFFSDAVSQSGLQQQAWRGTGFGAVAADFNLDGWPDIAIANGLIRRGPSAQEPVASGVNPWWRRYAQRQQIFLNRDGRFEDAAAANPNFCGEASVGRSLAIGDLDADGRPDLVLGNAGGPAEIFHNIARPGGNWIQLRLIETGLGGRDAIGAELRVTAGNRAWRGVLQPASSYCASQEPALHFGLGATNRLDRAEVIWASGEIETFAIGEVNRAITLKKGEGERK